MITDLCVSSTIVFALVPGSSTSIVAFVAICVAILASLLAAAWTTAASRQQAFRVTAVLAVGLAVYFLLIAAIVQTGIFERAFVPFGPLFLAVTIGVAITLGFSHLGSRLAAGVPLAFLVGFQGFRLPLEIVLHDWFLTGTIPESMTWTGSNRDIVSGIVALAVCPFVSRHHVLAWLANIVGIVLLVNVGRVAIVHAP